VKTQCEAGFIRGVERIGGFGGKSDILAHNFVFTGNADYYRIYLEEVRKASAKKIRDTARQWLSDGQYVLEVHPFPKYIVTKSDVDRSRLPVPEIKPEAGFPELQRTNLSNGLKIIFAERRSVPVVQFNLLVDAGYAADQACVPGTAQLAMGMLMEGTRKRTSLKISEEAALLGANLGCGSDLDTSYVSLNALKEKLEPSLDIFADVILNPVFPDADFKRLQKQCIAGIKAEKTEPNSLAMRILPGLLYGADHAYGKPLTGSGDETGVVGLTSADMRKFHATWFKPNNATLVITGDTTLQEITPTLERLFKGWKPGEVPVKNIATIKGPAKSRVYMIDRPGSVQSVICAGSIAPPKSNPNEIAIELVNKILGGDFTSRINMNLREEKHWTYGARSSVLDARGQRPFMVVTSVQGDKTKDAIVEVRRELCGVVGDKPVTEAEFGKAVTNQTLRLPGAWETMRRVSGAMSEIVRFGLPDNYFNLYPAKIRELSMASIVEGARAIVVPDSIVWVVVGDRAKVETPLRELGMGEISFIDVDGNPVK